MVTETERSLAMRARLAILEEVRYYLDAFDYLHKQVTVGGRGEPVGLAMPENLRNYDNAFIDATGQLQALGVNRRIVEHSGLTAEGSDRVRVCATKYEYEYDGGKNTFEASVLWSSHPSNDYVSAPSVQETSFDYERTGATTRTVFLQPYAAGGYIALRDGLTGNCGVTCFGNTTRPFLNQLYDTALIGRIVQLFHVLGISDYKHMKLLSIVPENTFRHPAFANTGFDGYSQTQRLITEQTQICDCIMSGNEKEVVLSTGHTSTSPLDSTVITVLRQRFALYDTSSRLAAAEVWSIIAIFWDIVRNTFLARELYTYDDPPQGLHTFATNMRRAGHVKSSYSNWDEDNGGVLSPYEVTGSFRRLNSLGVVPL